MISTELFGTQQGIGAAIVVIAVVALLIYASGGRKR